MVGSKTDALVMHCTGYALASENELTPSYLTEPVQEGHPRGIKYVF